MRNSIFIVYRVWCWVKIQKSKAIQKDFQFESLYFSLFAVYSVVIVHLTDCESLSVVELLITSEINF
ncbi:hypothetical protein DRF67_15680 [Chryseobacterium pennipullorum]|uniref:Uncharacterized protein n=1 Tax=Chryseobacterium pennipullorum TaxID=2258963 RepID=A0A3D9AY36_9FLAO|nr:hypothetical protein DRF67_15680 [Chryseobacterium pennipullorum]